MWAWRRRSGVGVGIGVGVVGFKSARNGGQVGPERSYVALLTPFCASSAAVSSACYAKHGLLLGLRRQVQAYVHCRPESVPGILVSALGADLGSRTEHSRKSIVGSGEVWRVG